MKSKILVTGGSGFVGTVLVDMLRKLGYVTKVADIKDGIDLTNLESINSMQDIEGVVHLAAITSVQESFADPWRFLSTNYMTTLGALEICRRNHSWFIHISSYLYGQPQYLPIDEEHPLSPHNPYAQSKLVSEELCCGYHRDFGIPVTIFRPFNLYGTGLNDSSLIPTIIRQLKTGMITIQDPEPKRDYLFVNDLCDAIIKAIEKRTDGIEIFNLGTGRSYSVKEVANLIVAQSEREVFINETLVRRKGEVMDCVACIEKADKLLGWAPKIPFEKGLASVVDAWGY